MTCIDLLARTVRPGEPALWTFQHWWLWAASLERADQSVWGHVIGKDDAYRWAGCCSRDGQGIRGPENRERPRPRS
jgi:hypothetical protein